MSTMIGKRAINSKLKFTPKVLFVSVLWRSALSKTCCVSDWLLVICICIYSGHLFEESSISLPRQMYDA